MNYIELFTPSMRQKPRFMALAAAILEQVTDLIRLVQEGFREAWNIETAVGAQLDGIGAILNVPRPAAETSDEDYRFLLRARIAAHHWDGTNESLPALLQAAFPDRQASMIDNQDGSVSLSLSGSVPLPLSDLFPLPAGIRIKEGGAT